MSASRRQWPGSGRNWSTHHQGHVRNQRARSAAAAYVYWRQPAPVRKHTRL